jgi:hypothetical protein
MIKALQAGFGDPLGASLLADLKALGVGMVRLDVQMLVSPLDVQARVAEVLAAGLKPLVIILPDQASWLPKYPPLDVEVVNEPDLAGWDPAAYADAVCHADAQLQGPHTIWAGGVSNCSRKKLDWLAQVVMRLPPRFAVSVHRYPKNGATPAAPQEGFRTRNDEMRALLKIVGPRPFGNSEVGYHTGPQKTGHLWWTRRWHWTDGQVAAFAMQEWQLWREAGARFATWYQLNDGTGLDPLDHYGIRYLDGTWKPVSRTFV